VDPKKFFSFVPFDTELTDVGDENLVEIEMLRVGKFDHPKYGDLDISLDFLQSLVDNFENNTLNRDVSFDWNHDRKEASAWLRGLSIIDDVLVGSVEFTKKGKESVEGGEYGYFSVEYDEDYEDPESGETHGPVLMGGALTNRPFINGLRKIEFEMPDDDSIKLFTMKPEKEKKKKPTPTKKRQPALTEDKLKEELGKSRGTIKDLQSKIKALEGKLGRDEEDDDLDELRELLSNQKETIKALTGEVKALKDDNVKAASEARRLKVESMCNEYMTEHGHHRGVVEVAKEIMLASVPDKKVIALTETHGEGDKAKTIKVECTMDEAVRRLLEAIPEEQRADFTEVTRTKRSGELDEEAEEEGITRAFEKMNLKRKSLEEQRRRKTASA